MLITRATSGRTGLRIVQATPARFPHSSRRGSGLSPAVAASAAGHMSDSVVSPSWLLDNLQVCVFIRGPPTPATNALELDYSPGSLDLGRTGQGRRHHEHARRRKLQLHRRARGVPVSPHSGASLQLTHKSAPEASLKPAHLQRRARYFSTGRGTA